MLELSGIVEKVILTEISLKSITEHLGQNTIFSPQLSLFLVGDFNVMTPKFKSVCCAMSLYGLYEERPLYAKV